MIHQVVVTITETIEHERIIEAESDLSLDAFIEQVRQTAEAWNDDPKVAFAINGVRYDLVGTMIPHDVNYDQVTTARDVSVEEFTEEASVQTNLQPLNESVYREHQARYEAVIARGKV